MSEHKLDRIIELLEMQVGVRPITPAPAELFDYADEPERPESCCGDCPPIAGGGYDCTCEGNPRCKGEDYPDAEGLATLRGEGDERCTVTLPRDVVGRSVAALYEAAGAFRHTGYFAEAGRTDDAGHALAKAYSDALDALETADTPPEPTSATQDEVARAVRLWAERFQTGDVWSPTDSRDLDSALQGIVQPMPLRATQDAPAGRIGWLRLRPDDDFRDLVREVEDGWSCDEDDLPDFPSKHYPDATFTPIATLPEGHVAVERDDLDYAVSVAAESTEYLWESRKLRRLRAAIEGSQS